MADNYVFKNLIWKFAGLNLILSAIGKWSPATKITTTTAYADKASFAAAVGAKVIYEIKATRPDVDCISTKHDLSRFWHAYQKTINAICADNPGCKEVCVLPAVPVSAAFEMGRRFMPGVYPKMRIFDFNNGFKETLIIGD